MNSLATMIKTALVQIMDDHGAGQTRKERTKDLNLNQHTEATQKTSASDTKTAKATAK